MSLSDKIAPSNTKAKSTVDIFLAVGSKAIAVSEINFLNWLKHLVQKNGICFLN